MDRVVCMSGYKYSNSSTAHQTVPNLSEPQMFFLNSELISIQQIFPSPAVTQQLTPSIQKISQTFLTICGSFDLLTQPEISFSVSRFTVLILLIRGCLVTISPATHKDREVFY